MDTLKLIMYIASFFAGGVMSLLIWFLTTKLLSPKMLLTGEISRTYVKEEKKNHYFLKIRNESNQRDIYDIACYVRCHFSDDSFYSETFPPIPLLKKKKNDSICKCERKIELKNINLANVNKAIQDKYGKSDNQINIDEFFEKEADNGYIEMIVICYDAFSGAKRCVLSKEFHKKDIRDGFYPIGSMKIHKEPNFNSSTESHADTYR